MKVGLVGFPGSGKTTIFEVLTGQHGASYGTEGVATVHIPDPRVDRLVEIYQPKKVAYAELTVLDLLAVRGGEVAEGGEMHLAKIAEDVDAFAIILQCFGEMGADGGPLDPTSDLETLLLEMTLNDLSLVERRIERIVAKGSKKSQQEDWELRVLTRLREHLSGGGQVRRMQLADEEEKALRGFSLLTLKPALVVLNTAEDDPSGEKATGTAALAQQAGLRQMALCGSLSKELAQLPDDEQRELLDAYGLTEPPRAALLRALAEITGTIHFLTGGQDEVRAWAIRVGTHAPQAAGKIHTDLENGFIRAEVIPYEALDRLGTEAEVKKQNLMRVEGANYVVKDGDILNIRFSR